MNISPVNIRFVPQYNYQRFNTPKYAYNLGHDTVSFGQSAIKDCLELQHKNRLPEYETEANSYINILNSIALDLKEYGFYFDKENAKEHAVKGTARYIDKIESSGSLDIRDKIRATMYLQNLYDTDLIINKLLPMMHENGYDLAEIDGEPDIDFRLNDRCQKSGYEDIQIRFVKANASKSRRKDHTPLELIILFGKNYQIAKNREHDEVYDFTRKFKDLHMKSSASTGPYSDERKAQGYIDMINHKLNTKISKKLYINAKNKDYYNIDEQVPITITDEDITLLKGYFAGLKLHTKAYYSAQKKMAADNKELRNEIDKNRKEDFKTLEDIEKGLQATLEKYYVKTNDNCNEQI